MERRRRKEGDDIVVGVPFTFDMPEFSQDFASAFQLVAGQHPEEFILRAMRLMPRYRAVIDEERKDRYLARLEGTKKPRRPGAAPPFKFNFLIHFLLFYVALLHDPPFRILAKWFSLSSKTARKTFERVLTAFHLDDEEVVPAAARTLPFPGPDTGYDYAAVRRSLRIVFERWPLEIGKVKVRYGNLSFSLADAPAPQADALDDDEGGSDTSMGGWAFVR